MRRTVRHRKRKGGKVIGEGVTAQVIDPPPPCKNRKDGSKYVARLSKKKTMKNLITKSYPILTKLLKKIDPKQEQFLYPERCDVQSLTEENKKDGITESNKKQIEIIRKGNEKWFDWQNPSGWRNPTEEQINHLKKGMELLHAHRIVHGDINGNNVIWGDDNLPRIIDFSESIHDAPEDQLNQEKDFFQRGLPKLDQQDVYRINTAEGKEINEKRKKIRRELLKLRKK